MAGRYYVFETTRSVRKQLSVHPLSLEHAKQFARIGAKQGKYDREVTTSPTAKTFHVVARYERGTGRKVTPLFGRRRR